MDVAITELEKIEADRIDGVGMPANGIPVLLLKQVAPVAKGARDCPKCDKSYDADHTGSKCENCGTDLPDAPASKAADDAVDCPTCKGDGKIMGDKRDCPDCDAKGKVSPAKAKTLAAKSLVQGILKAADKRGNVDEAPDIAGGTAVISQIADLIIAECQEIKAGNAGEIADVQRLACAAELIWCWRTGEEAVSTGSVMPATALMQSAAAAAEAVVKAEAAGIINYDDAAQVFTYLVKDRNYSAAERKEMAGDGRALPDGSYPINDEHDLNSAAILARSGHGDVDAAKKHIGKRAKELGVKNPLDDSQDDATKGAIAQEGTTVDTVTQETGGLTKAVEDAIAKATAPLQERIESLNAELAKVKATPVPGGLVLSRNVQVKVPGSVVSEDWAAKAAYYRDQASLWDSQDRGTAEGYRLKALEADAKAVTPTS